MDENIYCSYGGPSFSSQHTYDHSQPFITLYPGLMLPSLYLHRKDTHLAFINIMGNQEDMLKINTLFLNKMYYFLSFLKGIWIWCLHM